MANNNANIIKVSPANAAGCIRLSYETRQPIMLWGPPGIGKSALVYQETQRLGIQFIDLRLVQIDSVDLRGMPYKDVRDDKVVMGFAPSAMLPRTGAGILFLDELPQAPTLVQNSASELLLDRRVGEYILPDGWAVMCAGNRRTDRAATIEVPSHLKNRLTHIEVKSDLKDWVKWAADAGINIHVINFLKANPKHLNAFDADAMAFPTGRSWAFASKYVDSGATGIIRDAMIAGCVGEAVGLELCAYLDTVISMPTYADVIKNPQGVPLPSKSNLLFAMIGMVGGEAQPKDADKIVSFFKRLPHEEVRFALTQMMEDKDRGPLFAKHAGLSGLLSDLTAKAPA